MFGSADRTSSRLERLLGSFGLLSESGTSAPALGSRLVAPLASVVYRWYTHQLFAEVQSRTLPRHIAMILDGNRRFAVKSGLAEVTDGHRLGAEKVTEVVRWCDELSIPVVTLWGLSTENLQRSPPEVSKILEIVGERLRVLSRDYSEGHAARRVQAVGRLDLLPKDLRRQIEDMEKQTASSGPHLLNIAVAYGGRDEIIDAIGRMLRARGAAGASAIDIADQLTTADFQPYLYSPDVPEPDLIIRTSGELRLGGFLLWQSVYSELYFCDAPWPAFRKIDFLRAVRSFQARKRRFGQ